ncbi:187-kDa microtubule-associated protein AIR9 [Medicago truncatula]|uniref:Outer arm dynein light chain 1 n=1 Tax=Medicago truncatula TaxID=3880 RepID=A0A072UTG3_MEDTR|nr:187-kDa microtubule-associated protein AIR9-like [Medicago truncatula]KEH32892.1 outer arm dynein light chain 1 [Medicago truncatula]
MSNIIGDLREKAKVRVTGTVTGGTDGSSRVQWYKSYLSTLDENNLAALSTSTAVAKAFRIPPGAIGCYIVAKFTPMSPDGRSGEPTFVISDRTIECREG